MEGSGARIKRNARFILELKYLRDSLRGGVSFQSEKKKGISERCSKATGTRLDVLCSTVEDTRKQEIQNGEEIRKKLRRTREHYLTLNRESSWVKDRWKRGSSFLRSLRSPRKREFARHGKRVGKAKVERGKYVRPRTDKAIRATICETISIDKVVQTFASSQQDARDRLLFICSPFQRIFHLR